MFWLPSSGCCYDSEQLDGLERRLIFSVSPHQMLAKEILEDSLLSSLSQNVPDVEIDPGTTSEKVITIFTINKQIKVVFLYYPLKSYFLMQVLSKVKVGPSSLALLAKTAVMC